MKKQKSKSKQEKIDNLLLTDTKSTRAQLIVKLLDLGCSAEEAFDSIRWHDKSK